MNSAPGRDSSFDFCAPVRLHFGTGLIDRLDAFCGNYKRVLIVTGRSSARKTGLLDRTRRALRGKKIQVFDDIEPTPSIETVERGSIQARNLKADLVIGLGGGSQMDAAKAIAALAANKGGFREYYGKPSLPNSPVPVIAIPTTCGTGSESNRYSIITDFARADKVNFSNKVRNKGSISCKTGERQLLCFQVKH